MDNDVKDQIAAALPALDPRHAWKARTEVRMLRFVKSIGIKLVKYCQIISVNDVEVVDGFLRRVTEREVITTEPELDHPGTTFRGTFVPAQPAETDSRQVKRWAERAIRFHNISRLAPALSRRERRQIARGEQV